MKRIHKSLLWAAIFFGGFGGFGFYILKTDVRTAEERYLDQEREKRLFNEEFGIVHVKSGELMTRGTTIAFSLAGEGWRITSPVEWRGDKEALDAAITQMVGVQIDPETRVEKPGAEQLATWGLTKPRTRLTLETERGTFGLLVGPKNAIKEMYPITDDRKRAAGLSEPDFYWVLDKPLSDFRDRRVFPFAPEEIRKVRREAKEGGFVLVRDRDGFALTDLDGKNREPADLDRAEIFLVALTKRLRIGRFLTDEFAEKDAAQYGLDRPVLLEVQSKTATITARVGTTYETGDQKGTAVMHLAGTRSVFEVPDFVHEEVAKTKDDLKDRTVLRFDHKSLAKIELTQDGQTIVLEKSGDDWKVTAPKSAPARVWKIDGLVRVFRRLKAERFHTGAASKRELEEWLLDPPSRRLKFYDAKGLLLGDVRIGKYYSEKEIFALRTGERRVALIEEARLTVLPKGLDDLIDSDRIQ